ncbi:hypothetical protein NLI96_g13127 [Meripilus lineatus]|uniref:Uncharacterized protein n=1 Tax=Meripilus lineatus TaxID=2056292 RepID=A0AAD5UNN6_9APHY|nr:hypothetical protein NLI96_g13127 [Physisporinus lineatus]
MLHSPALITRTPSDETALCIPRALFLSVLLGFYIPHPSSLVPHPLPHISTALAIPSTEPEMASQSQHRYSLRKTNDPNPGKTAGVYKRTMQEIREEAAEKRALKVAEKKGKPARGKSLSQQHTEWANNLADDIRRRLQVEDKEYLQALNRSSSSINSDDDEAFVPSNPVTQRAPTATEPSDEDSPAIGELASPRDVDVEMGDSEFRALSPVDWNMLDHLLDESRESDNNKFPPKETRTEVQVHSHPPEAHGDDSDSENEAFRAALKRRAERDLTGFDLDDSEDDDLDREVGPTLNRGRTVNNEPESEEIVPKPTRKERRLLKIIKARSTVFAGIEDEHEDVPEQTSGTHRCRAASNRPPLVSHEDGGLRDNWRKGIVPPHKVKTSSQKRRNSESDGGGGLNDEDVSEERPGKEKARRKQMLEIATLPTSPIQPQSRRHAIALRGTPSKTSADQRTTKKDTVPTSTTTPSKTKDTGARTSARSSSTTANAARQDKVQHMKRKMPTTKERRTKRRRPASVHSLGDISDDDVPDSSSLPSEPENEEPNPDELWQRQAGKNRSVLATVFEWYGQQEDPWVIDITPHLPCRVPPSYC